ncbi:MAG TPA: peptidoglycan-binding domain-containing protein [Gaiellaceae bacterium]|jgi:F0F1-type ATP synthase membrane subunit c/vacuolar-type H+-ATPase subunit K|nr:peptidoglycan-binding domain-containing protein [Gaiellaceae bacterium]
MSTRETGSRDPDDWFAGSDAAQISLDADELQPGAVDAGDDWLGNDGRAGARDGLGASLPTRWVAIGAGVLLAGCLLVAGLVLGGVFDSAKHPAAAPPATAPSTTTAPATTTPTPAAATPPPTATLKPGDTGTQVEMLQRALLHLGYAAGKVDGNYGSTTVAALKQFQTAAKLTADGVLGPATLAALVSALRAP